MPGVTDFAAGAYADGGIWIVMLGLAAAMRRFRALPLIADAGGGIGSGGDGVMAIGGGEGIVI